MVIFPLSQSVGKPDIGNPKYFTINKFLSRSEHGNCFQKTFNLVRFFCILLYSIYHRQWRTEASIRTPIKTYGETNSTDIVCPINTGADFCIKMNDAKPWKRTVCINSVI